jgi:hypothetical protein
MASTRIGNVLRARICRAQDSIPGIEKGNGFDDQCRENGNRVDDQCREKGEGLMTSAEGGGADDQCREKGAGLMTRAERRGRG